MRVLEMLEQPGTDTQSRAVVLQEVASVCRLEYGCARAALKRNIRAGARGRYFRKMSSAVDEAGGARVVTRD